MRILADENIPLVDAFFAGFGSIRRMAGRSINRAALEQTDVLLVRSVTRVDRELLALLNRRAGLALASSYK